jgi:hypothetical protein
MNSPRKRDVVILATILAAVVTLTLVLHGTEEAGLRAVIRATARTSAICIALAFARIRAREFLIALPISHAMHFAAILALAEATTPANAHIGRTTAGGIAIFALMIRTAVHPAVWQIYALWIIFVIGFGIRDMSVPAYPSVMVMLFGAAVVRFLRRPERSEGSQNATNGATKRRPSHSEILRRLRGSG